MGTLKRRAAFAVILLLGSLPAAFSFAVSARPLAQARPTLFAQAVAQSFDNELSSRSDVSYLLLDVSSGESLATHWRNVDQPIPVGSLVKPFTALAYASAHNFRFPVYDCRGKETECWQPRPHGELTISQAVAVSCNSYFRELAQQVAESELASIVSAYGIESPSPHLSTAALVGLGGGWKIDPKSLAEAYLELYRRADQRGVREILEGMRLSAEQGTGNAIGRALQHSGAFAKTGTAPCTHANGGAADGFVVVLIPAERPEVLFLLRAHGVTGAQAATIAARVLAKARN